MTLGKSLFLLHWLHLLRGASWRRRPGASFEGRVGVGGTSWLALSVNFARLVCLPALWPRLRSGELGALAPPRGQGGVVEANSCPRPSLRARRLPGKAQASLTTILNSPPDSTLQPCPSTHHHLLLPLFSSFCTPFPFAPRSPPPNFF